MKSLTLTGVAWSKIFDQNAGFTPARGAVDPQTGTVYLACESSTEYGVEVAIAQVKSYKPGQPSFGKVVATFSTPATAPFPLPSYAHEVVDLRFFADDSTLVIIMAGGDIATFTTDEIREDPEVEIVGSVESGIKAAAWSPDDEQLVLVTGEDTLVCMTRSFDLVHEETLRSDQFGEDDFINVGWGSKSTQFHGSLGKAAAKSGEASSSAGPSSWSHHTDDGRPTITFRGDAAFFAISSLDPYPSSDLARRQIRIYSRAAGSTPKLSATSEDLPGLEGSLTWRPSGNLISGLVRYGYEGGGPGNEGRWDVAMLERNGLRHGGFELREDMETWRDGRIRGMSWNCDSEVLAIWIERKDHDVVQLWTMNNYHYYLKQELVSCRWDWKRFDGFFWHPEQPLIIYLLGDDYLETTTLVWDAYKSRTSSPNDTATVAVVDGDHLLMTPFRTQNVPPPMSSYQIQLPCPPTHTCLSDFDDTLAVLLPTGQVQSWRLNTTLPSDPKHSDPEQRKVADPQLSWDVSLAPDSGIWQAKGLSLGREEIAVLFAKDDWKAPACELVIADVHSGKRKSTVVFSGDVERILWAEEVGWLALKGSGSLHRASDPTSVICSLPPHPLELATAGSLLFLLSPNGRLYLSCLTAPLNEPLILANGVNSFVMTEDYLIYTTTSQSSHYAPIATLRRMASQDPVEEWETQWESRRIERGAMAVTACQSSMSLVLQMPRGNLETVHPRPLVLAEVRRDVLACRYRSAFITCRKHRLDLNLLHDLDPTAFMDNLTAFIKQVPEVDFLNLFVSSLKDDLSSQDVFSDLKRLPRPSDAGRGKVNAICDILRSRLEQQDFVKYTETTLTTYACKMPPDYEGGLRVLLRLQADHPDIVEDAVKFIIFLSNVNQLYDVALGMYDFQLVLMVAQYSQKDPKEYLPFLKELRALDDWERKFRIDDHLGRYSKALAHIHGAGASKFDDAMSYVGRYELFDKAFELYRGDTSALPVVYEAYGDYLFDRRDFKDAALAFRLASKGDKTLKAYEKAHEWRELFSFAQERKTSTEVLQGFAQSCSDYLTNRGRHLEASQILLDYTKAVDEAVSVLARGAEFAEAYRISSLYERLDLVPSVILPALDDAVDSMMDIFEEMQGQLTKEILRLRELGVIRREDPDSFYMVDTEPAYEGVDVATNATTAASAFTRYTVAPTTVMSQTTKMTGRTDRTKNKASKKRAAGRKGTVDEHEYLIASLGRLVVRTDEKSYEAIPLIRHLILASSEHKSSALQLQSTLIKFRSLLQSNIEEAWKDRVMFLDEAEGSGGLGLEEGQGLLKARELVKPAVGVWVGVSKLAM